MLVFAGPCMWLSARLINAMNFVTVAGKQFC